MRRQRGPTWKRAILLVAALAALAPTRAAAQPALRGTEADTVGLAADTARLVVERLPTPGRCAVPGNAVVRNRDDLRRLRVYPQCAKAPFPSLAGRTLVGLSIWGDCASSYRVDAFRSESRREFRVRLRVSYGGCRAMAPRYDWISLPALPPGWSVRITDVRVDGPDRTWDPEWTPIRAGRTE